MTNLTVTTSDESSAQVADAIRLLKPVTEVTAQLVPVAPIKKPLIAVVFSVAPSDIALAIRHAAWLRQLCGKETRHSAVIVYDDAVPEVQLKKFHALIARCFEFVDMFKIPVPPVKKWPQAPNWAFQQTALRMAYKGAPWLWFEPDCMVLRADWLARIQTEYDVCGKRFMGPIMRGLGHMNGVAVYPSDTPTRSPRAMSCQSRAFDYAMKEDVLSDCHDAGHLIQHVWSINGDEISDAKDGTPPVKITREQAQRWIKRSAVMFHRIKDASLIELLQSGWNTPRVEIVVCNWKRPDNIPLVLEALQEQTCPVKLTLIDASETPECAADHEGFDRVFKVPNMGSWNRLALAGAYDCEYTLFIDDDVIPAPTMVEVLLKKAAEFEDKFAVLGFLGRNFFAHDGQMELFCRGEKQFVVSWLSRLYFIKTENIFHALSERLRCGTKLPLCHDDVIMGLGITRHTGHPCYVLPDIAEMQWDSLPENDAVWTRPDYINTLTEQLHKLAK